MHLPAPGLSPRPSCPAKVLVFNCDGEFDAAAMGRIFAGLLLTGAWGCFDEFNRLAEDVLSAVSGQIQAIQARRGRCCLLCVRFQGRSYHGAASAWRGEGRPPTFWDRKHGDCSAARIIALISVSVSSCAQ